MTLPSGPAGPAEKVLCPICEVDDAAVWGRHGAGYTIVRCRRCGLRYLNPRRGLGENLEVYGDRYFDRQRKREADPEVARHVAENDRRYAATVLRYARAPRPSVLDIGSGRGSFLIHLARHCDVGRVAGTDIVDVNVEHLRSHGVELHVGEIGELDLGRWDVVTAHHVLEHVLDPNAFLADVRGLLGERGIVHLVLPNEGSLMSRWKSLLSRSGIKKRPFKHLAPEHHLWYFTPRTLTRLLEKNGFRVIHGGSTAGAKRRNPARRLAQRALNAGRLNTWLEFVAAPMEDQSRTAGAPE